MGPVSIAAGEGEVMRTVCVAAERPGRDAGAHAPDGCRRLPGGLRRDALRAVRQGRAAVVRRALAAIADLMAVNGTFIINDAVKGPLPVSPATQLHTMERLQYKGLWTPRQYEEVLESCGLHVVEYLDLSKHQAASYAVGSLPRSSRPCVS